jgi:hypothetical protein
MADDQLAGSSIARWVAAKPQMGGKKMPREHLSGCRVMVVEDDLLIAITLEDILVDEGCVVIGPFSRFDRALPIATTERLDAAVLDLTLRGREQSFPVAEMLESRGIPVVITSGYGRIAFHPTPDGWFAGSRFLQRRLSPCCSGRSTLVVDLG